MSDTLLASLDLQALVLDGCRVTRGDAVDTRAGSVKSEIRVEVDYRHDLLFLIKSEHRFINHEGDLVAQIEADYLATYAYGGPRPNEADVENYAENALMIQVLPFIREFLASMTNRLGIPTFYLPLFKNAAVVLAGPGGR